MKKYTQDSLLSTIRNIVLIFIIFTVLVFSQTKTPSEYLWTTKIEVTFNNGDKDTLTHIVKKSYYWSKGEPPTYTIETVKKGIIFDDPINSCLRSGLCGPYIACNVRVFKIIRQTKKPIY
jgi:hypothetical protein